MLEIRARRFGAVIATVAILATACSGGGDSDDAGDVVLRTQGDITVDADEVAETTTTASESGAGAGASEGDGDESVPAS